MINLGDYKKNDTIYVAFTTRNSSGQPTTATSTPAISVYKDAGDTEFTTGLTVDYDFDTRAGLVHVTIATTDAAYTTGSTFHLVFTAGQIGSTPIAGEVVARFTLEATAGATRSALGLLTANLDTQLSTIDAVVDGIKIKTDNLPTDPADASVVDAAISVTNGKVDTVAYWLSNTLEPKVDTVDTVVDAIKVKTDNLPANTATEISAIRTKTDNLPANTATVLTDLPINFWNFDFLANIGTVVNRFSGWNAMRHIVCKWSISGTTKTVHKEGTVSPATAYTTTLTLDGDGEITGDTP